MTSTQPQRAANQSTAKEANETPFSYDDVLEHIGHLGRYQIRTFLILLMPCFFFGLNILNYTFTAGIPQYRCRVDGCDSNETATGDLAPDWLNRTIPWSSETSKLLRQCRRFNETWSSLDECLSRDIDYNTEQLMRCDKGWIYDLSNFHSSIVTEFDLTCDEEWKHTLANSSFLVGMLMGAVTLGNLADIIGRRKTFTVTFALLAVCSTSCAFASDFWTFAVLRFFCGVFNIGFYLAAFVWGVEAVGSKYRMISDYVLTSITSIGSIALGVFAYFIRDWRTLQLVLSVPMFPLLIIPCILPESTRWLLAQKRYDEAYELVLKAAEVNGKTIPIHVLEKLKALSIIKSTEQKENPTETLIDIFRSPILCKHMFIMFVAWIGTNMGYYGITFSATNLSGDFYLNYILSMIVEPFAKIVSVLLMDVLGRRTIFCGGLITSGFFCLATGLSPTDSTFIQMVTSLIGKFFITASLGVIYLYTSEMFPTSTRSAAVGLCATMSKFGSIAAPALAEVGRNVNQATPYIIFAIVNISVGLLCALLPETGNATLPATIKDAENMNKYTIGFSRSKIESKEDTEKQLP